MREVQDECVKPVQEILQAIERALNAVAADADHAAILDRVAQELPEFFSNPLQIADDVSDDSFTLINRPKTVVEYPEDVDEILKSLQFFGYTASRSDIAWAYGQYCEDHWDASWMPLNVIGAVSAAIGIRRYLK